MCAPGDIVALRPLNVPLVCPELFAYPGLGEHLFEALVEPARTAIRQVSGVRIAARFPIRYTRWWASCPGDATLAIPDFTLRAFHSVFSATPIAGFAETLTWRKSPPSTSLELGPLWDAACISRLGVVRPAATNFSPSAPFFAESSSSPGAKTAARTP